MSSGDNSEVPVDPQKTEKVVRSQFYDVMVKVDADVYCLDRLQLAWKSDFFEKLFNEQSDQKECSSIELSVMDTNTFSAIVDIIYGQSLTSVLNHDNYVALLMAMNHLQMEIDMETYARFIVKNSATDVELFKLFNFVQENPNLQRLLPAVFKSLSVHLVKIQHNEDFLRLPLDDIIRIIISERCAVKEKDKDKDIDTPTMSQICSQWIHHDLQSRLPHLAKLVNAVRRRFRRVTDIKDEDFNTVLTGIAEEMNPEMTKKVFYKLLICHGEIDSSTWSLIYAPQKSIDSKGKKRNMFDFDDEFDDYSDDYSDDDVMTTRRKEVPIDSTENELKKLKTLVENHRFHDIVVTTGEKAYKLHRFMLNSASSYFAEIFSAKQYSVDAQFAKASTLQQIKSNEYSLLGVDQATCDMIFEYIYFDKLQLTSETIIPVFKAANTLKMEKLLAECLSWTKTKKNIEEICAKVLIADECIRRSWVQKNIAEIFSKLISEPATADTLPLCYISFDMLEDLLLSSFHCCNDPHKILDMCSKWVLHDVKNRYHLILKIALAINRNRITKYQEYKIKLPTDSNNCSEESIRNELWKTLNSTTLIPSVGKMPQCNEKKLEEIPVFVAWTRETSTIYVLNANLEQIVSLRLSFDSEKRSYNDTCYITATLMDDNLFIMLSLNADYSVPVFNVYNLSSKKFISLNSCAKPGGIWYNECTLLNCRGQVYCCFNYTGQVLKYSTELNRWMIHSTELRNCIKFTRKTIHLDKNEKYVEGVLFTSDGDKLYRLYAEVDHEQMFRPSHPNSKYEYTVDEFDFQQNAWLPLSDLSFTLSKAVKEFTIINGSMLTVLLPSCYMTFDQNSKQWNEFPMTDNILTRIHSNSFTVVQFENELLHVCLNKLYQWSEGNLTWDLKKELPLRLKSELSDGSENGRPYDCISAILGSELSDDSEDRGPYDCISAIHKRSVRTD
ncbi:uncharacterized protein LOC135845546 isoform X1 [Planococcus citri]|uniref:uncharacterized protein LOC135845546 isoform X1 n=1 Tax=Planococcus citri TaxID=170843 RepID=UPI0031F786A0